LTLDHISAGMLNSVQTLSKAQARRLGEDLARRLVGRDREPQEGGERDDHRDGDDRAFEDD